MKRLAGHSRGKSTSCYLRVTLTGLGCRGVPKVHREQQPTRNLINLRYRGELYDHNRLARFRVSYLQSRERNKPSGFVHAARNTSFANYFLQRGIRWKREGDAGRERDRFLSYFPANVFSMAKAVICSYRSRPRMNVSSLSGSLLPVQLVKVVPTLGLRPSIITLKHVQRTGHRGRPGNKTRTKDCMTPTVWNRAVSGSR